MPNGTTTASGTSSTASHGMPHGKPHGKAWQAVASRGKQILQAAASSGKSCKPWQVKESSSGIGRFCRSEIPTDGQLAQFRFFV